MFQNLQTLYFRKGDTCTNLWIAVDVVYPLAVAVILLDHSMLIIPDLYYEAQKSVSSEAVRGVFWGRCPEVSKDDDIPLEYRLFGEFIIIWIRCVVLMYCNFNCLILFESHYDLRFVYFQENWKIHDIMFVFMAVQPYLMGLRKTTTRRIRIKVFQDFPFEHALASRPI